MIVLENTSEILAYGAPKPKENIKEIILIFNEIESILRGMMDEYSVLPNVLDNIR